MYFNKKNRQVLLSIASIMQMTQLFCTVLTEDWQNESMLKSLNSQKEEAAMLTEVEQLLIDYLLTSNAKKGTGAMVSLMLQEESQQIEMCSFLSENPEATDKDIGAMAHKIVGNQH